MVTTWKSIAGPNFAASNALLLNSQDQITDSISGLGSSIEQYGNADKKAKKEVTDKNTLNLMNQLKAAGSIEELDALKASGDFSLESLDASNVNVSKVLGGLDKRKTKIQSGVKSDMAFDNALEQDKLTDLTTASGIADALYKEENRDRTEGQKDLTAANAKLRAQGVAGNEARRIQGEKIALERTIRENKKGLESDAQDALQIDFTNEYMEFKDNPAAQKQLIDTAVEDNRFADEKFLHTFEDTLKASEATKFETALYQGGTDLDGNTIGEGYTNEGWHTSKVAEDQALLNDIPKDDLEGKDFKGRSGAQVADDYLTNNSSKLEGGLWLVGRLANAGMDGSEVKKTIAEFEEDQNGGKQLSPDVVDYVLTKLSGFKELGSQSELNDLMERALELEKADKVKRDTRRKIVDRMGRREESYRGAQKKYVEASLFGKGTK